jgi:(2R)-sulfolactate sulfo-lyase subunit beta
MASKYSNMTVKAFRRENGRVGVRNHVVILPVDDISNAACEAGCEQCKRHNGDPTCLWSFAVW